MVESSQVMVVNLSDEDDFYIKQEVEEIESLRPGLSIFCVIDFSALRNTKRRENISDL